MQVYPPPGLSINFWPGRDSTNCSGPGAVEEMGEEKQVEAFAEWGESVLARGLCPAAGES